MPAPRTRSLSDLRIRVVPAIADVAPEVWDACANPNLAATLETTYGLPESISQRSFVRPYNPFISHDFLFSLEASGSAVARSGWQPQHLLAESPDGTVLGAMPCYLKFHSRGEYVFDRGWAEAFERAGGDYYPKLQVSVPFTPAAGPRLMVPPGAYVIAPVSRGYPLAEGVEVLPLAEVATLLG